MEFLVEIVAWSTYNPRADRGNFSWFKMENQFFIHMRQRKGASADATILLALLLTECSSANGAPFRFRVAFGAEMLNRPKAKVLEALRELEKMGDCVLKPASSALQAVSTLVDDAKRTEENGQKRTDTPAARAPTFDFEKIYSGYPRKEGKKRGLELCARQIKTPEAFEALQRAVAKYAANIRATGTEPKFVKHFDTFMGSWTDWSDPDAGKVRLGPPPTERRYFDERPTEEDIPPDPDAPAKIAAIMRTAFRSMPKGPDDAHDRDA